MSNDSPKDENTFDLRANLLASGARAIRQYIAQYKPDAWPGLTLEPRKPFVIPPLTGMPEDCLPLMVVYWTNAGGPQFLGLLSNTHVLYAHIHQPIHSPASGFSLFKAETYVGLSELFEAKLSWCCQVNPHTQELEVDDIYAIYLIEFYREHVRRLRARYPAIASLLVTPPILPPAIEQAWSKFEAEVVAY